MSVCACVTLYYHLPHGCEGLFFFSCVCVVFRLNAHIIIENKAIIKITKNISFAHDSLREFSGYCCS